MARSPTISPARQLLMQSIMWIILLATVGLAAVMTHYRRSAFEVKLEDPVEIRGVRLQLPRGWEQKRTDDSSSSELISAVEPAESDLDNWGGRILRVVREPLITHRLPIDYANLRLFSGDEDADVFPHEPLVIDRLPAIVFSMLLKRDRRNSDEAVFAKRVYAITTDSSGRGFSIELEGQGRLGAHDLALIRQIARSIQFLDAPKLADRGEIAIGEGITAAVPPGFTTSEPIDPLTTLRVLRSSPGDGPMRTISLAPITVLPNDGSVAVRAALSLFDPYRFEDAVAREEGDGVFRIDADTLSARIYPIRAYALTRSGAGVLIVFRGGHDDAWIDETWPSLRENFRLPEQTETEKWAAAGERQVQQWRNAGIPQPVSGVPEEMWWLLCIGGADRPLGWWHCVPGSSGARFEMRVAYDALRGQSRFDWLAADDLQSYRLKTEHAVFDARVEEPAPQRRWLTANLKNGKVEMQLRQGETGTRGGKTLTHTVPANYVPAGCLMTLMRHIDQPIILRTESHIDHPAAHPPGLLTVTLRPQADTRPPGSDENAPLLRCISLEFSGSGEKSLWYFQANGTLEGVEYAQSQRLIRRSRDDLVMDFDDDPHMRP